MYSWFCSIHFHPFIRYKPRILFRLFFSLFLLLLYDFCTQSFFSFLFKFQLGFHTDCDLAFLAYTIWDHQSESQYSLQAFLMYQKRIKLPWMLPQPILIKVLCKHQYKTRPIPSPIIFAPIKPQLSAKSRTGFNTCLILSSQPQCHLLEESLPWCFCEHFL